MGIEPKLRSDRKAGERGRNRTFNLLIKSQLLCQLSYAPAGMAAGRTSKDYIIRNSFQRRAANQQLGTLLGVGRERRDFAYARGGPARWTFFFDWRTAFESSQQWRFHAIGGDR